MPTHMQEQLDRIAAFFGLGTVQGFERAGGHAGKNFFVETDRGLYLAKVFISGSDAESAGAENSRQILPYMSRLSTYRFRHVPYLRSPDDEHLFTDGACRATVQKKLDAVAPEHVTARMLTQIGEELAQLHLVPSTEISNRVTWMDAGYLQAAAATIRHTYLERDGMKDLVILAEKTDVDWARLPQSILHGDMYPDNTLFRGETLAAFIDWDDVCLGASVLDFGMAVAGCCFDDDEDRFDRTLYQALYDGYQRVRPFSEQEKAALTPAVRRAGVSAAVWRFLKWNHYEVSDRPDDYYKVFWSQGLDRWEAP